MIFTAPTHYFLCAGASDGYTPLNAFDQALIAAGVGDTNLIRLSSILPPSCKQVEPFRPPGGSLVPVAYAKMTSSTPGEIITSAVAVGIPEDPTLPGLIMEYHGVGTLEEIVAEVREMAYQGMRHRNRTVAEIVSIGAEHTVEEHGGAFAGIVLWNGPGEAA